MEAKLKKYEPKIYATAGIVAAMAVPGSFLPMLDVAAVATSWAGMIVAIGVQSGRTLDKNLVLKFTTAIIMGGAGYLGGSKLLMTLMHFVPGIGTLGAVGANMTLNFLYTMRLGRFVAIQMEKTDFDTGDFANIIPDMTAIVFAMPSVIELKHAFREMNAHRS